MFVFDGRRSLRGGGGSHPVTGAHGRPLANSATDVALWSKTYREALPWAGITFPAEALRRPGVAAAVKRGGHCVDVHSGEELAVAVAAGIAPARIVVHDDDVDAESIRRAVAVGAGRFVIGCSAGVPVLASCATGPQRVLADVTAGDGRVVDEVLEDPRLRLIGLRADVTSSTATAHCYAEVVGALIAQMAHLRRERGVLLTRVSVAGGDALSPRPLDRRSLASLDSAIEDAIDDACARYRFPRPVLVLAPAL